MKRYESVSVGGLTFSVWADAPTLQQRLDSLVVSDDDGGQDFESSFYAGDSRARSLMTYSRHEKQWAARARRVVKPKVSK
jgi:hypothetical protein